MFAMQLRIQYSSLEFQVNLLHVLILFHAGNSVLICWWNRWIILFLLNSIKQNNPRRRITHCLHNVSILSIWISHITLHFHWPLISNYTEWWVNKTKRWLMISNEITFAPFIMFVMILLIHKNHCELLHYESLVFSASVEHFFFFSILIISFSGISYQFSNRIERHILEIVRNYFLSHFMFFSFLHIRVSSKIYIQHSDSLSISLSDNSEAEWVCRDESRRKKSSCSK